MTSLIIKKPQPKQCCAPKDTKADEKVAQCCAKVSKTVAGCHD